MLPDMSLGRLTPRAERCATPPDMREQKNQPQGLVHFALANLSLARRSDLIV